MKKLCSKCGQQLDLGKRTCGNCGAFNPFFISSLSSDKQNGEQELLEKQMIEKQLLAQEEEEKKRWEEELKQQTEAKKKEEQELALREALEKEKAEILKYENELKERLQKLEERQKNEEQLSREHKAVSVKPIIPVSSKATESLISTQQPRPVNEAKPKLPKTETRILAFAVVFILIMGSALAYMYFNSLKSIQAPPAAKLQAGKSEVAENVPKDSLAAGNESGKDTLTGAGNKLIAAASEPAIEAEVDTLLGVPANKPKTTVSQPIAASTGSPIKAPAGTVAITDAKVRKDIVNKKLSGCGITIHKPGEIIGFGKLTFVEKMYNGEVKYKFAVRVKQGKEVFLSTSYIYYDTKGNCVRIDGNNCEQVL